MIAHVKKQQVTPKTAIQNDNSCEKCAVKSSRRLDKWRLLMYVMFTG